MPITVQMQGINDEAQRIAERVDKVIFNALSRLGEMCVAKIRERSAAQSWCDQTGNLRSSIGYAVVHNGNVISISDFAVVGNGAEGATDGKSYASKVASGIRKKWALIVVAGMNYASYVEVIDSKDVLANTELWARAETPKVMAQLEAQISKIKR